MDCIVKCNICSPISAPTVIPPTPCNWYPCRNGGTCVNEPGPTFKCYCPPGFTDDICSTAMGGFIIYNL